MLTLYNYIFFII